MLVINHSVTLPRIDRRLKDSVTLTSVRQSGVAVYVKWPITATESIMYIAPCFERVPHHMIGLEVSGKQSEGSHPQAGPAG